MKKNNYLFIFCYLLCSSENFLLKKFIYIFVYHKKKNMFVCFYIEVKLNSSFYTFSYEATGLENKLSKNILVNNHNKRVKSEAHMP